ncbi:MAG: putative Ig domain-containing protein [Desulfuromonadales bacterium]
MRYAAHTFGLFMALLLICTLCACSGGGGGGSSGTPGREKSTLKVVFAGASAAGSASATIQSLGITKLTMDVIPANPASYQPPQIDLLAYLLNNQSYSYVVDNLTDNETYMFRISAYDATNRYVHGGQTITTLGSTAGTTTILVVPSPADGFSTFSGVWNWALSDGTYGSFGSVQPDGTLPVATVGDTTQSGYVTPSSSGFEFVAIVKGSRSRIVSGTIDPAGGTGSISPLASGVTASVTKVGPLISAAAGTYAGSYSGGATGTMAFTVDANGFVADTASGSFAGVLTMSGSAVIFTGHDAAGSVLKSTFDTAAGKASGSVVMVSGPSIAWNATRQATGAPAITSAASTNFVVGTAGSFSVTASGFPAPTVNVSGTLPAGVTFNPATGILSGTPATGSAGVWSLTIKAANGYGADAVQSFTLTVNSQAVAPVITSANAATFTVGSTGSFTVMATGSPAPTLSVAGTLPTGVSFNPASGILSGTPATGTADSYSITFRAANGTQPDATQSFTLTVNNLLVAPSINSASAATFTVGTAGSHTVTSTGSPSPTLSIAGTLPAGVSFNPATGVLSGTPVAGTTGSYPLTFKAANGVLPDATQTFTLTVNEAPVITSTNSLTATEGVSTILFTVTASGFPTPAINLTGTLPTGVSYNPATGTLSGTPAIGSAKTYTLTFSASNGVTPAASQTFTLTVIPNSGSIPVVW